MKRKPGRKPVRIDLIEVEKLCSMQCTLQEIADWFGVSVRTIEARKKRPEFAAAMQLGYAKGRICVRRTQMKILENGNATMAIWLGKQMLGQRDMIKPGADVLQGALDAVVRLAGFVVALEIACATDRTAMHADQRNA